MTNGRHRPDAPDDLAQVVAALTRDVEVLDSMIRSQRSLLERAVPGTLSGEEARRQWTRIRARADVVVNRAQGALEVVKKQPSE
jgi:hypothetical protein